MSGGKRGKYSLVTFYLLAFGISWVGFVPVIARSHGVAFFSSRLWMGCLVLPGVGPAVAAWLASVMEGMGREFLVGVWASVRRLVAWRWWVAAVVGPVGIFLVANGIGGLLRQRGAMAPERGFGLMLLMAMSIAANPWEEIGWRGFALERLQARMRPVWATLLVGAVAHTVISLERKRDVADGVWPVGAAVCGWGVYLYVAVQQFAQEPGRGDGVSCLSECVWGGVGGPVVLVFDGGGGWGGGGAAGGLWEGFGFS